MAVDRRETAHRVSVTGNTIAGTAGAGFGAAKLRDSFKEDYPKKFDRAVTHSANRAIKRGRSAEHVSRLVHVAQVGKPGFVPLAVGSVAGALAAGAHRYGSHLDNVAAKKAKKPVVKSMAWDMPHIAAIEEHMAGAHAGRPFAHKSVCRACAREAAAMPDLSGRPPVKVKKSAVPFGGLFGEISKADQENLEPTKQAGKRMLHRRLKAATSPPPPVRQPVKSTAINSLGYQKQTRRMDVEFHSRPGQPYSYRMKPKDAQAFTDAGSKGRHYATKVKGKYPGGQKVRVSDRARLFADPPPNTVSKSAGYAAFGIVVPQA